MIKLVDYFVVVGYDPATCTAPHQQQQYDLNTSNDPGDTYASQRFPQQSTTLGKAKIIQRFPLGSAAAASSSSLSNDDQEEFDANVHCFCQPHQGWRLYAKPEPPTFFVSVLTDIRGRRRYCACLTFLEPYRPPAISSRNQQAANINNISKHNSQDSDENSDEAANNSNNASSIDFEIDDETTTSAANEHHVQQQQQQQQKKQKRCNRRQRNSNAGKQPPIKPAAVYAAKSLMLISRLDYVEFFKSCLSLVYASYVDKRANSDNKLLELIVANMLTIQVHAPGTAQLSVFSLGADDRHCIQAAASLTVPATGCCVYRLFGELGVVNVLRLVCAVAADYKVLFFSRSSTKLYEACRALESLLFPLKYTGVYVPVLPCFGSFLEFPAAPTPYIIGVHADYRRLIEDMHQDSLQECVKVDLDGAAVTFPQCVEDLICGIKNGTSVSCGGSSATSSGVTSISSSSASSFADHHSVNMTNSNSASVTSSFGLPHHLYESTLNLLFALLKPDVLHADELTEFSQQPTHVSSTYHHYHHHHRSHHHSVMSSRSEILNGAEHLNGYHENAAATAANATTTASSSNLVSAELTSLSCSYSSTHLMTPTLTTVTTSGIVGSPMTSGVSQVKSGGNSSATSPAMSQFEIDSVWMDKMLRAVFVRLFAQLFAGYRYALLIVRINPRPVIGFNKPAFLSAHRLGAADNEFMTRLLDSMSFQRFVEERGPSYRNCDVFDDVYASVQSQLLAECEQHVAEASSNTTTDPAASLVMLHLRQIAEKLFKYEYPHTVLSGVTCAPQPTSANKKNSKSTANANSNSTQINEGLCGSANSAQLAVNLAGNSSSSSNGSVCAVKAVIAATPSRSYSKIRLPTPDAHRRIHAEQFPMLDEAEVERLIAATFTAVNGHSHVPSSTTQHVSLNSSGQEQNLSDPAAPRNHLCRPHLVPYGPPIETVHTMTLTNRQLITNLNSAMVELNGDRAVRQLNSHHQPFINVDEDRAISPDHDVLQLQTSCARKLATIAHCVANIFAHNFKEVKRTLNSAYRVLRDPRARLHLCACLRAYVRRNQVILSDEQFEFVCKLLNEALACDTRTDEHGVACVILPLASAFYRKLGHGTVDQCVYTRLQQHEVWSNVHFWEMAFYADVQRSLRPVYLTNEEFAAEQQQQQQQQQSLEEAENATAAASLLVTAKTSLYARPLEKTALEICGEQMERSAQLSEEQREAYVRNEQGIVRSHVLHYITQMVNMKIPFDINCRNKQIAGSEAAAMAAVADKAAVAVAVAVAVQRNNDVSADAIDTPIDATELNSITQASVNSNNNNNDDDANSLAASDDSGYEQPLTSAKQTSSLKQAAVCDGDGGGGGGGGGATFFDMDASPEYLHTFGELGYDVWRFTRKFVDRVCHEGALSDSQRRSLHSNLADVISMQIQMLDTVYAESRRVPARTKPRLDQLKPEHMLPGECILEPTPLRCYLVPDGRDEVCGRANAGTCLLPAEGALVLTNYRLIFRGVPVADSLMNDAIITRSFPLAALIKEKKCAGSQYKLAASAGEALTTLHDGLQMRSCTFQLIKVYFDEEASTDKVDRFRSLLFKLRYPTTVLDLFCFGGAFARPLLHAIQPGGGFGSQTTTTATTNGGGQNSGLLNGSHLSSNMIELVDSKHSGKEKHGGDALRHFAKNTLRKAGLMPRSSNANSSNRKLGHQATAQQQQQQHVSAMAARTPETARRSLASARQNSIASSNGSQHHSAEMAIGTDKNAESDNEENLSIIDENLDSLNSMCMLSLVELNGKQLERVFDYSLAYKDFLRQGLINLSGSGGSVCQNSTMEDASFDLDPATASPFRLCTLNVNYQLCKSLPAFFIVPASTSDDCIRKNVKCHRQGRLPVIVWRHTTNRAVLLRSSGFHGKGFIGMLMKGGQTVTATSTSNNNETSSSMEQDKYINDIVKLVAWPCVPYKQPTDSANILVASVAASTANVVPTCMSNETTLTAAPTALATNAYLINSNLIASSSYNNYSSVTTPTISRRSIFASKIEKAVQTIKNNMASSSSSSGANGGGSNCNNNDYSSLNSKFNTIASLSSGSHHQSHHGHHINLKSGGGGAGLNLEFDTNSSSQLDALNESFCSSVNSTCQPIARGGVATTATTSRRTGVPLYIICERSQIKSFRSADISSSGRYMFLPVDVHDVKDAKNSFKKLCRACVPSAASAELTNDMQQQQGQQKQNGMSKQNSATKNTTKFSGLATKLSATNKSGRKKSLNNLSHIANSQLGTNHYATMATSSHHSHHQSGVAGQQPGEGLHKQLQESKWFEQLQLIMNIANLVVDRMDSDSAASVMVCLEDGWDLTSQVTSIAQLLMDPYYRTIEGFPVLIEREWLSMGHRFTRRNNHTIDDQTGFAPIFLQFLDIVHQCLHQYPNAFEFNEFFIEFIAYHYVSNRFRTFLLDSEFERVQYGLVSHNPDSAAPQPSQVSHLTPNMNKFIAEQSTTPAASSLSLHTNVSHSLASSICPGTTCLWEYMHKVHFNSAKFFNFNYQPNLWRHCVLRPSSELYKLKLWRYFFKETLCTGPIYDLDLVSMGNLSNPSNSSASNDTKENSANSGNVKLSATTPSSIGDESWYPVPIQTACDYYEQLEQILPTQYEILLKQIIRKYRLNETPSSNAAPTSLTTSSSCFSLASISRSSTNEYLHRILSANGHDTTQPPDTANPTFINWKSVWDYFYQLAEAKIIKDFENKEHNGPAESIMCMQQQQMKINQKHQQLTCSIIKPYLSSIPTSTLKQQHGSQQQQFLLAKQLQSSSSSQCSQVSATPPFPKVRGTTTMTQLNAPVKLQHNFAMFLFSSVNVCKLCNSTFKSTTQFVGLKCKTCSLICHEQCSIDMASDCAGASAVNEEDFEAVANKLINEQTSYYKFPLYSDLTNGLPAMNVANGGVNLLDISTTSIQTASSCSVTPNSHYSNHPLTNGGNDHSKSSAAHQYQYNMSNNTKLDIGSVCAVGFNSNNEFNQNQLETTDNYGVEAISSNQKFYTANYEIVNGNNANISRNFIDWAHLPNNEHQTYAGYLKKQGALFKQWKERYFVLDSVKHQLRYYDCANDLVAKGIIDLSEVESINQGLSSAYLQQQMLQQPSTTKKALNTLNIMTGSSFGEATDSKSCFELKTSKRVYYFCANSPQDAYKWIKQLEMCCTDS